MNDDRGRVGAVADVLPRPEARAAEERVAAGLDHRAVARERVQRRQRRQRAAVHRRLPRADDFAPAEHVERRARRTSSLAVGRRDRPDADERAEHDQENSAEPESPAVHLYSFLRWLAPRHCERPLRNRTTRSHRWVADHESARRRRALPGTCTELAGASSTALRAPPDCHDEGRTSRVPTRVAGRAAHGRPADLETAP